MTERSHTTPIIATLTFSCVANLVMAQHATAQDLLVREGAETPLEVSAKHEKRLVHLTFAKNVDASLASAVKQDLAAELSARSIEVSETAGDGDAVILAEVLVEAKTPERVVLDVTDRMTDKRVTRTLSLSRMPQNGRALAIAIAIDELLRASWAELTLSARASKTPEPAPVTPAQEAPEFVKSEMPAWLALSGTVLSAPGDFTSLGGVLSADLVPMSALWLSAGAGFERGLARDVGPGSFHSSGFSARAALGACRVRSWSMCLGGEALVDVLSLDADAEDGTNTRSVVKPLVVSSVTGVFFAPITHSFVARARLSLGTIVTGIEITDGSNTLSSIEGAVISADLGLGVSL